jgi:hypothetical protein
MKIKMDYLLAREILNSQRDNLNGKRIENIIS